MKSEDMKSEDVKRDEVEAAIIINSVSNYCLHHIISSSCGCIVLTPSINCR